MIAMEGRTEHIRLPDLRSAKWPVKSHCVATGRCYVRFAVDGVEEGAARLVVEVADAHYTPTDDSTADERSAVHELNSRLSEALS